MRYVDHPWFRLRSSILQQSYDALHQQRMSSSEYAAPEHDRHRLVEQLETPESNDRHRDDLLSLLADEVHRHRVARGRDLEQHRRRLELSCARYFAKVQILDQFGERSDPEVRRQRGDQGGRRTASVVGAGGSPERLLGKLLPTAPITGQLPDRREARGPAVRQKPRAIDART